METAHCFNRGESYGHLWFVICASVVYEDAWPQSCQDVSGWTKPLQLIGPSKGKGFGHPQPLWGRLGGAALAYLVIMTLFYPATFLMMASFLGFNTPIYVHTNAT
eukprot:7799188-Ditylum_brightwellii.AAC.1